MNRGYRWLVWAVLTAGLLLTGIVWNATRLQAGGETAERFAVVSNEARDAIESRVRGYSEILMGVRVLHRAHDGRFSGREFTAYVAPLDVAQRYPGIQGIHYAQRVTARERETFEAAARRAGEPGFAIKPLGQRDESVVVRHVVPRTGNEVALGLDLAGDPVRALAACRPRPGAAGAIHYDCRGNGVDRADRGSGC